MQSIARIHGSDLSANASQMVVSTVRAPGASSILVNTVAGVSASFMGTMGAPHTFTDPITGEIITLISEATAVDFAGHINSGHLEIDAIAPGYSDTRGSAVGDVVVIRPTTQWSDNLANVIAQAHNDDGTFKADSITDVSLFADPVDPVKRASELMFDFVVSGGGVLAGLGYGSTLTASLSAGVCYINGNRQLISAVATRAYTTSKDTYVDALYNASGTVTIVYTEVANNAASPALAANSIRLGIVVTGANIASVASINQGQETKVLPIASSIPYAVTDSLGNLICPRDPNRRVLGYRQITSNATSSGTANTATNLQMPVIIPVGRKYKVTIYAERLSNSGANASNVRLFSGAGVGGTQLQQFGIDPYAGGASIPGALIFQDQSLSGSQIFSAGLQAGAGTLTLAAAAISPSFIQIELV